jgi:hypothetical protein
MTTNIQFLIISSSVLLRMRNVSAKRCRENQNAHLMFNYSFSAENCAVYEITRRQMVEPDRPDITI